MAKQIRFWDAKEKVENGGILLDNGLVICGCCGGEIPKEDQTEEKGFVLLETYKSWVDISDAIIGL